MTSLHRKLFNCFKSLYGRFGIAPSGKAEYYLKLDGCYYCQKKHKLFVIIQVRNKRIIDKIAVQDIIMDRDYIRELHPADACIIGMLANNERNGLIDTQSSAWQQMQRFRECSCFIKSEPLMRIKSRYTGANGKEMTLLYSQCLQQDFEIETLELCNNQALLYAIDPIQAMSVGFDASELLARQHASQ